MTESPAQQLLKDRPQDWLTPLAKGVLGACPVIGPMLSETVGMVVPNQRVERIIAFVRQLEQRVCSCEDFRARLERHLGTPQGVDLLEESLTQAARAISENRQRRLAQILGTSLTAEELKYEETKKILNLVRELTDPEIVWLTYYSVSPTFGSNFHKKLVETHPKILEPADQSYGAAEEEVDRAALQRTYKDTLQRLGLLEAEGNDLAMSRLGEMLFRYIQLPEEQQDLQEAG